MTLLQRLRVPEEGGTVADRWINNDIKPIEAGRRKWGFWTFNNYCMYNPIFIAREMRLIYLPQGCSLIAISRPI